ALQDHLLRRLRGDASEVLRGDVLALDLSLRDVGPVDVEIVVRDERVGALSGLDLERLELLELALPRFLDQAFLDVRRQLHGVDAEIAQLVDLDRRVTRRSRYFLVCSEERVLECCDERAALDPLFALDVADGLDDLLTHLSPSIKLPRTIESYGMSTDSAPV